MLPACTGKLYELGFPTPAISISSCKAASEVKWSEEIVINWRRLCWASLNGTFWCNIWLWMPSSYITYTHFITDWYPWGKRTPSDWSTSTYNYQFHVHLKSWQFLDFHALSAQGLWFRHHYHWGLWAYNGHLQLYIQFRLLDGERKLSYPVGNCEWWRLPFQVLKSGLRCKSYTRSKCRVFVFLSNSICSPSSAN